MNSGPSEPRTKRRIRLLAPILLMAFVALIAGVASTGATFNPTFDAGISDNEASANADILSHYIIPANDVNFDSIVTYTPPDWFVAEDTDIPLGDTVGVLETKTTLGLTFTPCNIPLNVNIDLTTVTGETPGMINATADTSDEFTSTGNIGAGPNTLTNKWNGYDIMPSGNMRAVDHYPSFLNDLFPTEPRARYFGISYISSLSTWVLVQFLVFDPGANIAAGVPHDAEWGYGSLTVVNNPSVGDPSSSAGDFCTSSSNPGFESENTVWGETEDGDVLRTNPECGGTYTFHGWIRGRADDPSEAPQPDGFENYIDTCPFDYDPPSEDPRLTRGPDGDSIMSSCDKNPDTGEDGASMSCWPGAPGLNDNCDNDKFANTADNCPRIFNNEQEFGGDADMDQIGDACDDSPASPLSERPTKSFAVDLEIEGPVCGEETATPTPTVAAGTATATPTPSGEETATATATPPPGPEGICGITFPGTYNGSVRLNGAPANGYVVTAEVGGEAWGSAVVENGRYALDVPSHPPATPPCFPPEAGVDLVFKIDGGTCTTTPETTSWSAGLHDVDLACAPAATATPSTPPPSTQPPVTTGTPKVTATPAKPPSTGGGGLGGDGDLPLWAIVLAGWAGLTALAGLGTLATRIAKR